LGLGGLTLASTLGALGWKKLKHKDYKKNKTIGYVPKQDIIEEEEIIPQAQKVQKVEKVQKKQKGSTKDKLIGLIPAVLPAILPAVLPKKKQTTQKKQKREIIEEVAPAPTAPKIQRVKNYLKEKSAPITSGIIAENIIPKQKTQKIQKTQKTKVLKEKLSSFDKLKNVDQEEGSIKPWMAFPLGGLALPIIGGAVHQALKSRHPTKKTKIQKKQQKVKTQGLKDRLSSSYDSFNNSYIAPLKEKYIYQEEQKQQKVPLKTRAAALLPSLYFAKPNLNKNKQQKEEYYVEEQQQKVPLKTRAAAFLPSFYNVNKNNQQEEYIEEEEIIQQKQTNNNIAPIAAGIILPLVAAGTGYAIWKLLKNKKAKKPVVVHAEERIAPRVTHEHAHVVEKLTPQPIAPQPILHKSPVVVAQAKLTHVIQPKPLKAELLPQPAKIIEVAQHPVTVLIPPVGAEVEEEEEVIVAPRSADLVEKTSHSKTGTYIVKKNSKKSLEKF